LLSACECVQCMRVSGQSCCLRRATRLCRHEHVQLGCCHLLLAQRAIACSCLAGCVEKPLAGGATTVTLPYRLWSHRRLSSSDPIGDVTVSAICALPGHASAPLPKATLTDYVDCLYDPLDPTCPGKLEAYYTATGCGRGSPCDVVRRPAPCVAARLLGSLARWRKRDCLRACSDASCTCLTVACHAMMY
jgi:hypothetical protein